MQAGFGGCNQHTGLAIFWLLSTIWTWSLVLCLDLQCVPFFRLGAAILVWLGTRACPESRAGSWVSRPSSMHPAYSALLPETIMLLPRMHHQSRVLPAAETVMIQNPDALTGYLSLFCLSCLYKNIHKVLSQLDAHFSWLFVHRSSLYICKFKTKSFISKRRVISSCHLLWPKNGVQHKYGSVPFANHGIDHVLSRASIPHQIMEGKKGHNDGTHARPSNS